MGNGYKEATVYLFLLMVLLTGCSGSNAPSAASVNTDNSAAACIVCHSENTSPGTGVLIRTEWTASAHNTSNGANSTGFGAGCRDCHEPSSDHPSKCATCHGGVTPAGQAHDINRNPDAARKCDKCHGPTASGSYGFNGFKTAQSYRAHFNNVTAMVQWVNLQPALAAGYKLNQQPAAYVSTVNYASNTSYVGNCRKCHNPHDPTTNMQKNREWSGSVKSHGSPVGAWQWYDMKLVGGTPPSAPVARKDYYGWDCVRCHTTTGFINFVRSGFSDVSAWGMKPGAFEPTNNHKEMVGCDACHDDGKGRAYGFGVRPVPPMKMYFNYQRYLGKPEYDAAGSSIGAVQRVVQYKDLGMSNLCVACHTGKFPGNMLNDPKFANISTMNTVDLNPHFMAAASLLLRNPQQKYAFEFYTSQQKYANYDGDSFGHDKLGLGNYRGTGNKGPCISCHMAQGQHTFLPTDRSYYSDAYFPYKVTTLLGSDGTLQVGKISALRSAVMCAKCHTTSENYRFAQFPDRQFPWNPDRLNQRKEGYFAARQALYYSFLDLSSGAPVLDGDLFGLSYLGKYGITFDYALARNNVGAKGMGGYVFDDYYQLSLARIPRDKRQVSYGAIMNATMLFHDDGAFAHNSLYTRRTLYDTLDWIYDLSLDGKVMAAINSLPVSVMPAYAKEAALHYLFDAPMSSPQHKYDPTLPEGYGAATIDGKTYLINVRP